MSKALLIIDLQNDYYAGGSYPLWNVEQTTENIERAIAAAQAKSIPVILVQHLADKSQGPSPFFNEGSAGANIHPRIVAAAPTAPVVVKAFADSFEGTTLAATLAELGVDALLVCGMMTQNCVTHTAISRAADNYDVTVLSDCCTTVDEMVHQIALHGMSPRVKLLPANEAM